MAGEASLLRECLERIGEHGVRLSREFLRASGGSKTLQDSLDAVVDQVNSTAAHGRITVPYHWALYVHDGRGRIHMPEGTFLCYFPDKRLDPRTNGGLDYPATPQLAQHLSASEFYGYLNENRERVQVGLPPVMIVTETVGPVKKKRPFFTIGLKPLVMFASQVVPPEFTVFMQNSGLLTVQRGVVRGRLGK